jgi:parallel beta-helix repeat protein
MKPIVQTTLLLGAGFALSLSPFANAQGPLAPPGAPAPLFKTLDQVEPRRPIESLPFTINQPGSYYLTGNLNGAGGNGITIIANNVTLDLMGFALVGGPGTTDGVNVSVNVTNITIRNGSISRWGGMGVDADTAFNSQISDVRSSHNGSRGIYLAGGGIISGCTAQGNGTEGIRGQNGTTISGCSSSANNDGVFVGAGSTVIGCSVLANRNDGIVAGTGSTVSGNSSSGNTADGISVGSDCQVVNNTCDSNGAGAGSGAGIHVTGGNNRIEGNSLVGADRGLDIDAAGNFVANNTVVRNTTNYDIVAGNQLNLLLGAIPQAIPWPATVKLAGSLTGGAAQNGITITSDDVTVDLDGHSLIGVAGSLDGIQISGNRTNIVIRNGTIRRWGSDGVQANTSYNSTFVDLRVANNGANGLQGGNGAVIKCVTARGNNGDGITTASGCVITDSASSENRSDGIVANTGTTVSGCSAYNNNFAGISASTGSTVVNCTSYSNTNGISASSGSTVTGCTATSNATNGIIAAFGATITGCTARDNRTGINVGDDSRIVANTCDQSAPTVGDVGILVTGSDNRIDSNHVTDNSIGIDVNGTGNLIIRNTAAGNTTAYSIGAGNNSAAIIAGPGVAFASTAPWANFSY